MPFYTVSTFSVSVDEDLKRQWLISSISWQREAVIMADLEETQENVKATAANDTASGAAVQQALLISCMQKIVHLRDKGCEYTPSVNFL